jgi:hypothetical protein
VQDELQRAGERLFERAAVALAVALYAVRIAGEEQRKRRGGSGDCSFYAVAQPLAFRHRLGDVVGTFDKYLCQWAQRPVLESHNAHLSASCGKLNR